MSVPTTSIGADDAPLLTRPFILLVIAHFTQALGWCSMLLLPLYLDWLGASRAEIGRVMATGAIGGLMFRPLVGWSLDAWGRKPTLVAGTFVVAIGMAAVALVHDTGPAVYIARYIFGMGTGALFSGYFTLCTDLVPVSRRTEGIALFGISGLVPLAVNPFAEDLGVQASDIVWFLPVTGAVVLLSLIALRGIPEPLRTTDRPRLVWTEVQRALRSPNLSPVWLATIIFATLATLVMTFATVTAQSRGLQQPATYWLAYASGAVCVRLFGARMLDRIGPSNLVTPALAACIAGVFLLTEANTLDMLRIAGLVGGMGHGLCFPVLASQVASRCPDTYRGSALSTFTALWDLCFLLAPPLLGELADRRGDAAMFAMTVAGAIVLLALWVPLEHRARQH
jgi:MFS family permease